MTKEIRNDEITVLLHDGDSASFLCPSRHRHRLNLVQLQAVYLFWTYHVQANRLLQGDARNAAMELGQVVDNDEDAIS